MFAAMKAGIQPTSLPSSTESFSPSSYTSLQSNNNNDLKQQKRPQVKVFNIPENSKQDDLKEFFSCIGDVKHVKILPVQDGKTTTLGFVEFDTEEECHRAVVEKNSQEFNGSELRVTVNQQNGVCVGSQSNINGYSSNTSSNSVSTDGVSRHQVKVFNIPDGTGDEELMSLFSSAGVVANVKVLPCREGKDVTLGFVHFSNGDEVAKAVLEFNDYDFKGSKLRVMNADGNNSFAPVKNANFMRDDNRTRIPKGTPNSQASYGEHPARSMGRGRGVQQLSNMGGNTNNATPQRRPQAKVFGFPAGTVEDDVARFFSVAGAVRYVKLLPIREGKDTHLGFVEFDSAREVNQAVQMFDGKEFNGSYLKVMSGTPGYDQHQVNNHQKGGESFRFHSSGVTGRIPREERLPQYPSDRDYIGNGRGPAYVSQGNGCRRCGEEGHWARECLNAPVGSGSQAVTYIPPPPPQTEQEIFSLGILEGINFEKYEDIPVELTGNDASKPMSCFENSGLHEICQTNIGRASYKKPTPVQKYAIPAIIARRDLMACAQTGSGKTAAFLLPIITNILSDGVTSSSGCEETCYPLACILAPTRELAVQIFKESRKFAFKSAVSSVVVYGGVSVNHQLDILSRGCHILVATPGRLDDFVKRGRISFQKLKYLVLDEADRMLDMGFGPQIHNIIENSAMPKKGSRTTLMFSATFPEEVQQMAAKFLNNYLFLTVGRVGGTCADVQQEVVQVPGSSKRTTLEQILQSSGTDRTLVFVEKKRDADFLASFLSQRNYPTTSINGDRSQQEREDALQDFKKGVAPVLIATAVAARGLDINDVKHVVNYDLPSDINEYVHRIGRTGRIGNKGMATAFFDMKRDEKLARGLVKLLSDAEQNVPEWLEECALSAIGTGYGPDGGQYEDRRTWSAPATTVDSKFLKSPIATAPVASDEDNEDW